MLARVGRNAAFERNAWPTILGAFLSLMSAQRAFAQEVMFPMSEFDSVRPSLPQAFSQLETILGDTQDFEDMAQFSEANRYRQKGRPIGRLKIVVDSGDGSQKFYSCTAWIVATDLLMTNHHCTQIYRERIRRVVVEMGVLSNISDFDRYEVDTNSVAADESIDFALHRVDPRASGKYGKIDLAARAPAANEELFIIHHPGGGPQKLTRRNCRLLQAGRGREFHHSCDTIPGSSGSPIFSDNDEAPLALHNRGTADIIATPYNGGIRLVEILSFVREAGVSLDAAASEPAPALQPDPRPSLARSSSIENDWARQWLKPASIGTHHVIVRSMGSDLIKAKNETARLRASYPDLDFCLIPTVSVNGGNEQYAILLASGLGAGDASRLAKLARDRRIAPDAYVFQQTGWDGGSDCLTGGLAPRGRSNVRVAESTAPH